MKIGLDLAKIFMELKKLDWHVGGGKGRRGGILLCNGLMFICLFVCLFVCWPVCFFILNILGHPQEYTLKIS